MNTQSILITGGSGFIGKNLVEKLSSYFTVYAPKHAELELLDEQAVYSYLQEHPVDIIIHAANLGGNRNNAHLEKVAANNIQIFKNVIAAKPFFGRMITLGSGAEYDKSSPIEMALEEDANDADPKDEYGAYKSYISDFASSVDYITHIRLFAVFGPYEDYRVRFISNNICRALFDLPLQLNQNVYFDFTYIDDVVQVITWMIEQEQLQYTHYNVCSGVRNDLLSIAKQIQAVSKKDIQISVKKEGLNNEYTGSNERLLQEMKTFAFTQIEDSISQLYMWYETHIDEIDKEALIYDNKK